MKEYVPEINCNKKGGKQLSWVPGEIVVVLSTKNERGVWPLGKIIKVLPHKGDNCVRKLEIRMGNKIIVQSVHRILKLEK